MIKIVEYRKYVRSLLFNFENNFQEFFVFFLIKQRVIVLFYIYIISLGIFVKVLYVYEIVKYYNNKMIIYLGINSCNIQEIRFNFLGFIIKI